MYVAKIVLSTYRSVYVAWWIPFYWYKGYPLCEKMENQMLMEDEQGSKMDKNYTVLLTYLHLIHVISVSAEVVEHFWGEMTSIKVDWLLKIGTAKGDCWLYGSYLQPIGMMTISSLHRNWSDCVLDLWHSFVSYRQSCLLYF